MRNKLIQWHLFCPTAALKGSPSHELISIAFSYEWVGLQAMMLVILPAKQKRDIYIAFPSLLSVAAA